MCVSRTPTCSNPLCSARDHDVHSLKSSDIGEQIEVFIVFVLAALSEADSLLRLDEFNSLNPLDHLVTKLVLNAQPQRGAIHLGERLPIHLGSKQALGLEYILKALRVVVRAAVERAAKGEERNHFGVGLRPHEFYQTISWEARPIWQYRSSPECSDAW